MMRVVTMVLVTTLTFFIPELGKTAAELGAEEKDALSHRGQALARLIEQLGQIC
jgi:RNAse PH (EC 2.7.7.56)